MMNAFLLVFLLCFSAEKSELRSEKIVSVPDNISYEYRFFWQNSDRTDVQEVFVNWTDDASKINFSFGLYSKKCELKITGTAVSKPNQDAEIDEDDEGNAYAASEYVFEDKDGTLYIRIAEDKEKCKIHYESKKKSQQSCEPLSDLLMYSE